VPHAYVSSAIPADNVMQMRRTLAKDGIKVSMNDFVIKAVALALRAVPEVNVQYKNESVVELNSVDISVAVATPTGLITPIVFAADQKGIETISKNIRDLAERARQNKLKLNEFQGGSFTISNLGMFGISHFTAIINPPQTAILAVGGVRHEFNEQMQAENRFTVTLCYDGRAIDEEHARRFLGQVKRFLANPETMLSGGISDDFDLAALL
jgi:pyruvate/2-oxoglutarate dehydrogenase complex dihydrolipoamide acyltransferase (E2) component